MKVLYLLPEWVLPVDRGLRIMSYCLLKYLSKEMSCSVLGFNLPRTDDSLPPELSRLSILGSYRPCRPVRLWLSRLRHAAGLQPPSLARFSSPELHVAVAGLAGGFDIVHYDIVHMAQYLRPEVPSVLLAPDAYSIGYEKAAKEQPANAPAFWFRAMTMRRLEKGLYPKFTRVVVVSKTDQEYLARQSDELKISYIPLPVPEEYFRHVASPPTSCEILASGHFRAPGVLSGLLWYLREVHPRIMSRVPHVRLHIAGDGISPMIKKLAQQSPGVDVLGFVPDYLALLSQCSVYVCCDSVGSGANSRVAQALALAKPVVGTPVSLRGLEVRDGEEVFIRDDGAGFADAVKDVLLDKSVGSRLGAKGREFARERHHPRTVAHQMIRVYESAIRSFRSTPARSSAHCEIPARRQ